MKFLRFECGSFLFCSWCFGSFFFFFCSFFLVWFGSRRFDLGSCCFDLVFWDSVWFWFDVVVENLEIFFLAGVAFLSMEILIEFGRY